MHDFVLPVPIRECCAVVMGDKIHLFGGRTKDGFSNQHLIISPTENIENSNSNVLFFVILFYFT